MGNCCMKPHLEKVPQTGVSTAVIIKPADHYKFPHLENGYGCAITEIKQIDLTGKIINTGMYQN